MLRLLLLLCGLAARALGMTFTPSPDEAGHMRSNWDNWGMIHNVRQLPSLLCCMMDTESEGSVRMQSWC